MSHDEAMDSARSVDLNGYVEIHDNPITMAGVFPYKGRTISPELEPERVYMVLRPEEELSKPECVESFKLMPFTDDHPDALLGVSDGFVPAERKGVHGTIGERVRYEGGKILGNIKLFSAAVMDLMKAGKKELSAGYRCTWEKATGASNGVTYDFIQRNIRCNHLALVEFGRCGPHVAVLDSADIEGSITNDVEETKMEGEQGMTIEQLAEQLNAVLPQVQKLMEFMEAFSAKKKEEVEVVEVIEDEIPVDEEENPVMDAAMVEQIQHKAFRAALKELSARDDLVRKASPIVGVFDAADMTLAETAAYIAKKAEIAAEKGHELSAVRGFLAASNKPQQTAMDAAPRSSKLDEYLKGSK